MRFRRTGTWRIAQGKLLLHLPTEPRGQRMPIDAFLRSLAEDQGDHAVAIILSGTGTDGTLGLRSVFGAGGLCLAQDPETAKFSGMPSSAVHSGYVNPVLAHAFRCVRRVIWPRPSI
ncbi:MAG: chemotaxis protein CheB [Burkholderiaceae bacterium]|nr:chemotaxis protein CheB [Burkholderiaceae bacterium]